MDKLITPEELSEKLDIPIGTLYQWRYRNVGPRSISVGRHIRYRRSDIEEWLEANATQVPA